MHCEIAWHLVRFYPQKLNNCNIDRSQICGRCDSMLYFEGKYKLNNYIVRSYRDVIVVTNTAARRTNKAWRIVMY